MRKDYQNEWHGIPFESFTAVSSSKLADANVYSLFYKAFFKKYHNIEELDPLWVELKLQTARFLIQHNKLQKESSILSVGCGLGIAERSFIDTGFTNLEVTEVSEEPLRWLLPYIPRDKVHVGFFPECLPNDKRYDVIILSSVEYFFDQVQLISFLKSILEFLSPGGVCLLISWSFEDETVNVKPVQRFVSKGKDLIKYALDKAGIKKYGQFWGYKRNRKDFNYAMKAAGFKQINDGFLEKRTQWETYWIEGRKA